MNPQYDRLKQKVDIDQLTKIIAQLEDHMIKPFKKNTEAVAMIEPKDGEELPHGDGESPDPEALETRDADDGGHDLSDEDLEAMLDEISKGRGKV